MTGNGPGIGAVKPDYFRGRKGLRGSSLSTDTKVWAGNYA